MSQRSPSNTSAHGRQGPDRRGRPTSLWNRYFLRGQRLAGRRVGERQCYIDRPQWFWIALTLSLLLLGVLDATLTHYELGLGLAREANPIMRWWIATIGANGAWALKIAVTAVGCWVLLAHVRWLFGVIGVLSLNAYYVVLLGLHLVTLV